jgi:hypothetical protein
VDPVRVVDDVSQALGEGSEATEQLLRGLFRAYLGATPTDWTGVEQVLSAQSIVAYDEIPQLLDALKNVAGQAGDAEDPRKVFDDPELQGHFATAGQGPDTGQAAGAPVTEGSAIYQVGEAFYLGQDHQVQLWPAESEGSVYYHDGTNSYDELGRPLGGSDAASPAAGQPQQEDYQAWNSYLAQNGPRWDGTEESWPQFREWFVYDAGQNQVGESAKGFIALAESGDKREVFTSYGVTLPAVSAASEPGGADYLLQRLHREVMEPALTEVMADPELAALGEERLRELLAEVTAEHLHNRIGSTTA